MCEREREGKVGEREEEWDHLYGFKPPPHSQDVNRERVLLHDCEKNPRSDLRRQGQASHTVPSVLHCPLRGHPCQPGSRLKHSAHSCLLAAISHGEVWHTGEEVSIGYSAHLRVQGMDTL